jgi:hypothetical protein
MGYITAVVGKHYGEACNAGTSRLFRYYWKFFEKQIASF